MAMRDKLKLMATLMLLVLGLMTGGMESALAYCTAISKDSASINIGKVDVAFNAPVGTVIYSGRAQGPSVVIGDCDATNGLNHLTLKYNGGKTTGIAHVYQTNIPGVGVSVDDAGEWYYENPALTSTTLGPFYVYSRYHMVNLVKVGTIDLSNGNYLLTGDTVDYTFDDGIDVVDVNITGGTINVLPAPCHINNNNDIQVHFGNIDRSILTETAATAPPEAVRTIQIPVTCDDGSKPSFSMTWHFTASGAFEYSNAVILSSNTNVGVEPLMNSFTPVGTDIPMSFPSGTYQDSFRFVVVKARGVNNSDISTGVFNASAVIKVTFD